MDSQTSFAQGMLPQFLEMIGIGSVVRAGEAHWPNGIAEPLIGSAKRTMRRIRNEDLTLSPEVPGSLTAHAHNHTDRCKGFSPVQWCYGINPDAYEDPRYGTIPCFGTKQYNPVQSLFRSAEDARRSRDHQQRRACEDPHDEVTQGCCATCNSL